MKIQSLFERDIYRAINGVVKADQMDDASVWQELDEFVMTKELDQHFRNFFSTYGDAIKHPNDLAIAGKIGVWVSGFFGSGKSHFIKVLSYLLRNQTHHNDGQSKAAVEFFESKIKDAMLLGDVKRAVASNTDVILFNIDSKADHRTGRDAILAVFLRVLNEMQGYSGDHPHIAHLERFLENKRKLDQFHHAFRAATGSDWKDERDAYHFHRDAVVEALMRTLKLSKESAEKWVDGAEDSFALTIENFCKWVKQYLDSKGKDHRIVFLVDEVGQFIGTDSHLMLNLQTLIEELGTICAGRAWVIVTSQEDIDAVLGEMRKTKAHDFSKIQGRFRTRLSLSSANVDEVIQSRLLAKRLEVVDDLRAVFDEKGDILKSQMTFTNCGMTLKPYKDGDDFIKNYPFAPYQFQLVQRVFERIRQAGATGLHLSRGERSILDAFQSAARQVALQEVGILVPLYGFYPSIESFLDTAVKKTINQAKDNTSLETFDIHLLEALFLIRYVEEVKGTVDNLVTLFIDEIDADRLALRRKIEESLQRLEKQTLVSRNGDIYFFLTNEERDISREIKAVEITGGEGAKLLGELIFNDALKDQRKYRYPVNKVDFTFNRFCDRVPVGSRSEGALAVSVVTPLNDDYEAYDNSAKCVLESSGDGGQILIRLGNDDKLGRELRAYMQTDKYLKRKNDGTLPESTRRILRGLAEDNQMRRGRLVDLLGEMMREASYYVAGQSLNINAASHTLMIDKALEYLVQNSFTKMGYLKVLNPEPEKEVQAVLRSNDISQQTLKIEMPEGNKQALDDVRNYIHLATSASRQVILHEMIEKKYALRPYGWPDGEVLILIARLLALGEISLMMDGALVPANKAYEAIITPARRRKTLVIRRQTSDPKALQNARNLGKELFHQMGPDGEDALLTFLQGKLRDWQATLNGYKALADTGNYPGQAETAEGLLLVRKLLGCDSSFKFIEQFNSQREALSEFADQYHDLTHFYDHQKQAWDKLQKAYARFQLNRMEMDRDELAAPALRRMQEILTAPAPYGLIKEADGLINTVGTVNAALVGDRRAQALEKINAHINSLTNDIAAAKGDEALCVACLKPLESLRAQVENHESLAHITQMETEAVALFDTAIARIEEFARNAQTTSAASASEASAAKPAVRKQRVIEPAKLASTYLETREEVEQFLYALRKELEDAIEKNERVQIR